MHLVDGRIRRSTGSATIRTPRAWTATAWIGVAVVALTACGGSGGSARPSGAGDRGRPGPATASTPPTTPATTPSSDPCEGGPFPVGTTDCTVAVGGTERRYRTVVPDATARRPPTAVVVVLHGGGGEGLGVSEAGAHPLAEFRTVAARENVVLIYPEGLPARDGRAGWTDCRADNRVAGAADDMAFLDAVVARARAAFGLPASRVFMAGSSNGGQMTLAYALQRPDAIGGIAVANANLPETPLPGPCTTGPARAVPALLVHGTTDPAMPYAGGCVANLGGNCARGRVASAEATRDLFLTRNGLSSVPTSSETIDTDPTDAGPAQRFVYAGPAPVEWWRMDGGGHSPPSVAVRRPTGPATGPQNRDVEFAEIAWAFLNGRR